MISNRDIYSVAQPKDPYFPSRIQIPFQIHIHIQIHIQSHTLPIHHSHHHSRPSCTWTGCTQIEQSSTFCRRRSLSSCRRSGFCTSLANPCFPCPFPCLHIHRPFPCRHSPCSCHIHHCPCHNHILLPFHCPCHSQSPYLLQSRIPCHNQSPCHNRHSQIPYLSWSQWSQIFFVRQHSPPPFIQSPPYPEPP